MTFSCCYLPCPCSCLLSLLCGDHVSLLWFYLLICGLSTCLATETIWGEHRLHGELSDNSCFLDFLKTALYVQFVFSGAESALFVWHFTIQAGWAAGSPPYFGREISAPTRPTLCLHWQKFTFVNWNGVWLDQSFFGRCGVTTSSRRTMLHSSTVTFGCTDAFTAERFYCLGR